MHITSSRYNPPVIAKLITEQNHSRFFIPANFPAAQAALEAHEDAGQQRNMRAEFNTIECRLVEDARARRRQEAELLGLTVKRLRVLARLEGIKGRSKLDKAGLAHALAFSV
jgi:hypothetical protein